MGGETMHDNTRQTSQERTGRKSRDGGAGTGASSSRAQDERFPLFPANQKFVYLNIRKLRLLSQCILVPSSLVPSGSP